MRNEPLPFPASLPEGYEMREDEPPFDPARHLALEQPSGSWSLAELGYEAAWIARRPSPLAVAGPFRLLSPEGAATLEAIALDLRRHAQQTGRLEGFESNRNQTFLAGGAYRSRFIRALCHCPDVLEFCSGLAGTPLGAHSLPSQQVYINYAPEALTADVDIWHADSIGFDYVLLASDPATFEGGSFEFFRGTRVEAAALLGLPEGGLSRGGAEGIPEARIESIDFPGPGYALIQQGRYVVHRARRLTRPGQRVTLVPGLFPLDCGVEDPTDLARIATYGEPGIAAEIARHGAWRARGRLAAFLAGIDMDADPESLRDGLARGARDIEAALRALESPRPRGERKGPAVTQ